MNPLISLLLVAAVGFAVIVVLALIASVVLLYCGKRYAGRQQEELKKQILALLPVGFGEAFAEKLLLEEAQISDCPDLSAENAEKLRELLENYYREQAWIRTSAENHQKKRPRNHRIRALLIEKREKGEW